MNLDRLKANLDSVRSRVAQALDQSGRPSGSVRLVAVTKRSTPELVRPLISLGILDLGENYPQELARKFELSAAVIPPPRWHLIGHLQSNKVKKIIGPLGSTLVMIHSIDSLKLLDFVGETALAAGVSPAVCLQVNTSAEPSKHGWTPDSLLADAYRIAAPRAVPVVGLMTMAALGTTAETARGSFVRLRELRDELATRTGLALPELSMGMSNDYETAVLEGATHVRVGSALFEGVEE